MSCFPWCPHLLVASSVSALQETRSPRPGAAFRIGPAPCLPGAGSQGSPSGHNLLSAAAPQPSLASAVTCPGAQKACLGAGARRKAADHPLPRRPCHQEKGARQLRDFFCWCQTSEHSSLWGLAAARPRAPTHTSLPGDSLGGAPSMTWFRGTRLSGTLCLPFEGWLGLRVLVPTRVTSLPAPLWS